jgi:Smg protein
MNFKMQQKILTVITFLFQNYWHSKEELPKNFDDMLSVLGEAGFEKKVITKTFEWLSHLSQQQADFKNLPTANNFRIFTIEEKQKIDKKCQDFILFLENEKILNSKTREILINQLLQLQDQNLSINDVKWVALLVLFNEPDARNRLTKLENMILK